VAPQKAHRQKLYTFGPALTEHTDVSGNSLGNYQPRDYAGSLSLATDLEALGAEKGKFSASLTGKYISSQLIWKASALAFDAGLAAKTSVGGRV